MKFKDLIKSIKNKDGREIVDWMFLCNFEIFEKPKMEQDCYVGFLNDSIAMLLKSVYEDDKELNLACIQEEFKELTGKEIKIEVEE